MAIGNFDIADIPLVSPSSGATVGLPQTFQWTRRTASPTDSYELNLYDYVDFNPWWWTAPPLGYVNSYTLNSLPTGFTSGTTYAWYVAAYSPDGGYGESYYSYQVTFSGGGLGPALRAPTEPALGWKDVPHPQSFP